MMKNQPGPICRLAKPFAVALLLFSLCACATLPEEAIVGRWNAVDGSDAVVFARNGVLTVIDRNRSELVIGSYQFVAKDRLKLDSNGKDPDFKSGVATVAVSGKEMTLTGADGKSSRYLRAE